MLKVSLIVCTHNRAALLKSCLESLYNQDVSPEDYEVIVVDNNSTDETEKVVSELSAKHPSLRYHKETRVGASYARNAGYQLAQANWIGYIDDDAVSFPTLVSTALYTINNYPFDTFGGIFYPWYVEKKPWWVPEKPFYFSNVVGKPKHITEFKGFNAGCGSFYKKAIVEDLGGFNTHLGMSGSKIAYGEETELQVRIQQHGYKVGFNPEIKFKHYVAPYKLNPGWFYKSAYAVGESYFDTFGGRNKMLVVLKALGKSWYVFAKNTILLKYEPRIIFLETLKNLGYTVGLLESLLVKSNNGHS